MALNLNENKTPVFDNGDALQVPRLSGARASGTIGAASVRLTLPANTAVIELVTQEPAYINFGAVTVDATAVIATDGSRLILAGTHTIVVPISAATGVPYLYVAFLEFAANGGILQVEKLI